MAEEGSIQVNFGKPMALFPLDSAALLPQQVMPLHVFEPRYVQMTADVLKGPGLFAMAVFAGSAWKQQYHGRPALRRAACVAHILRHEKLGDGRFNVLIHGVCRARIMEEMPPTDGRLYREARLMPVGIDDDAENKLYGVRSRLRDLLTEGPLTQLAAASQVVERIENEDIPTNIILDLVSFALISERDTRYRLLEEADAGNRAEIVEHELADLQGLIRRAAAQRPEQWPKGCSWN